MFCRKCGYQLEDDAEFCTQCGTRIQPENVRPEAVQSGIVRPEVVQSKSIHHDMVQVSVNNSASDDVSSVGSKQNKSKKGIKKQVLIPVIAVVVIAIIAAVILVVVHKNKKSLTPQEDAIDRYFNAINDVDYEEFNHVVYSEDVADKRLEEDYARGSFLNNHYFSQYGDMQDGLANLERLRMMECVKETYSEYLEQSGKLSEGNYDEPEEWLRNHFSASYKINYIKAFDDCKLQQWRSRGWTDVTKDDIEKAVSYTNISTGESIEVEVDDIYVASINFEWEYDGNLYGLDKELWKNNDFIEVVEGWPHVASYADAVDSKEEYFSNVIMVVYSVDDHWYAMPYVLSKNMGSYSVAD